MLMVKKNTGLMENNFKEFKIMTKKVFNDRTEWLKSKGELHRDGDKPAVEYTNGNKEYWVNGKLHRDNDLPAVDCE